MWRWLKRILISLVVMCVLVSIALAAFLYFAPTFGAPSSGAALARITASPNYRNGKFRNLVDTRLDTSDGKRSGFLKSFLFPPADKNPQSPLPSHPFSSENLKAKHFVWFGHSTVLFNTDDLIILTDPVFYRASPVPLIGEAFEFQHSIMTTDLPALDAILISHDHYDHLDHRAIQDLQSKTAVFLVPLGIGAHLKRWGVPSSKIVELDWYDSHTLNNTEFSLTPSRHFSGRGFTNGMSTLWGSWVVHSPDQRVFFSGDTGYFNELKKIGDQFGPFDIAFLENGAYDDGWNQIHMMPEQAVQASLDLRAKIFFPVHWSKFDLALHPWLEPVERAAIAARKLGVTMATPEIGEIFTLETVPLNHWWRSLP